MNKKNYLLAFLIFGSTILLRGQVFLPAKSTEKNPLLVILSDAQSYQAVLDSAIELNQNRPVSIYVSNGDRQNLTETNNFINDLLNQDSSNINTNNIYLGIIGDSSFFENNNRLELGIFPAKFFVNTGQSSLINHEFYHYTWNDFKLNQIYDRTKTKYLWGIEKIESLKTIDKLSPEPKKHFGIGLNISQFIPKYNAETSIKAPYNNFGINAFYQINQNWILNGSISASLKKPNFRRLLSDQINPTDLQSGSEVTLDINEQIEIRTHIQSTLDLKRYLWRSKNGLRLYSSTGITNLSINQGSTFIDTTLTIDPAEFQSSGAPSFDQDEIGDGFELKEIKTIAIPISMGIELHSSTHALLNLKTSYLLNDRSNLLQNSLNIQLNLSFKLYKQNKKRLEYFQLRP